MESIYQYYKISRQAHQKALLREQYLQEKELLYINLMQEIRQMHPGMGLRKMYAQFQPEGIGRDAFIALGLAEGFRLRAFRNPSRTTWRDKKTAFPNLLADQKFTDVNQIWTSDITYFSLEGKFYYIVLIMDVYSRKIVGYSVANHMRVSNNMTALEKAIKLRGIKNYENKLIHHSDRGSQYTSLAYVERLENLGIQISMCEEVLENAHIERANGIIKNEYLQYWEIKNEAQLKKMLQRAVENYNNRLHQGIEGKTPNQFEEDLAKIPKAKRVELKIFTYQKDSRNNPNQIGIFQHINNG